MFMKNGKKTTLGLDFVKHHSILFFPPAGWIDVTWDSGGPNSYRMGAEGKYDLHLAPSHDPDKLQRPETSRGKLMGASVSDKVKVHTQCHVYLFFIKQKINITANFTINRNLIIKLTVIVDNVKANDIPVNVIMLFDKRKISQ